MEKNRRLKKRIFKVLGNAVMAIKYDNDKFFSNRLRQKLTKKLFDNSKIDLAKLNELIEVRIIPMGMHLNTIIIKESVFGILKGNTYFSTNKKNRLREMVVLDLAMMQIKLKLRDEVTRIEEITTLLNMFGVKG